MLEFFLTNANAPSVLHLALPQRSERLWLGGGGGVSIQYKGIMFCLRNLELGMRGQFRLLLPIVCGEIVAFHSEVTNFLVQSIPS